jgi:hypothetical protein
MDTKTLLIILAVGVIGFGIYSMYYQKTNVPFIPSGSQPVIGPGGQIFYTIA